MPLRETKIAPVFFLGLGGCGGSIVDELARKVKQEESFNRYRDLIQFFALDTDVDDLAGLHWIDTAHKFTLSNFDKPEYVDLKQGELHAKEDELFTQWWPEWYRPRATRGKGAGQIRIESRLALYYQLENDRGKIVEILEKAIRNAYDVHNSYRANKAAKIYVFASLAGGTGSGGLVTMALTLRRLLGGQRGHQLIGTFVMPNVFKSKGLPPNQFDKVMANGYSALQELELLQSASPIMPVRFHYDPDHPEHVSLDRPAFDEIYLVEEKTAKGTVIADAYSIYNAIADTSHTQIFSPILDKQGSTLDNDTRELMQLDDQSFTKSFGSFGISALVLPIDDILEYCALRLGRELLVNAVPGGVAALGDGHNLDEADKAFANGVKNKAESSDAESAQTFGRIIEWVAGGGDAGEGAVASFLRRCAEQVAKDVDAGIKLRGWDETELSSFEDDPERVQSELNNAWTSLKKQLSKSDEETKRRAQRSATEVIAGSGPLSLAEITRGRGPTEDRYLYIRLREALLQQQDETRQEYDRAISFDDSSLQEEFRRQVDDLKDAAPKKLTERIPGRENDYFELAANFANWYRDTLGRLRRRLRANALLEFYSVVISELDRRRESGLHFFARIDRINHMFEDRAKRLLDFGGARREGSDANLFVLDVEVLQDHRTGKRLWDHVYARIIKPGDFQLSSALPRLSEIAAGGGSELDIQRRIIDSLLEMTSEQLRARISGSREGHGLDMNAELETEARLVHATRRLAADGALPPVGDPKWEEEMRHMSDDDVRSYVKDKMDFTASKCQPFITLGVGAPYLPEKAYAVLYPPYIEELSDELAQLSELPMDKGNIIEGEDPHKIVFYKAQLGCALHAIKSLVDYERRYFAVKQMELAEGSKVPGQPDNTPQIPIHQDCNWEGAPNPDTQLFRISIEGVKANESKLAWFERVKDKMAAATDSATATNELRDFTMGIVFGQLKFHRDGPSGDGFYIEDETIHESRRRLGKFRDQAFEAYRNRNTAQKQWLHDEWTKAMAVYTEERDFDKLKELLDAHAKELETQLKNADHLGGKQFAEHLEREKATFLEFRAEKEL